MKIRIRPFGAARDILGGTLEMEVTGNTVLELRETLHTKFPALRDLKSLLIAVNQNYADDNLVLNPTDEVALIPPVSGG
ncbi:MAG: MoaD/ThiS family protein [Cytophagales bacterium]|nr:MoaD/ThiS family protein [Cytophagales bacterium]